ncbi:unnamed protein product [Amoebophrya sp. A25]|nr:unnamed protein product [Amoebophrya sp. A25]|eukprot:GSA25T00020567001.1
MHPRRNDDGAEISNIDKIRSEQLEDLWDALLRGATFKIPYGYHDKYNESLKRRGGWSYNSAYAMQKGRSLDDETSGGIVNLNAVGIYNQPPRDAFGTRFFDAYTYDANLEYYYENFVMRDSTGLISKPLGVPGSDLMLSGSSQSVEETARRRETGKKVDETGAAFSSRPAPGLFALRQEEDGNVVATFIPEAKAPEVDLSVEADSNSTCSTTSANSSAGSSPVDDGEMSFDAPPAQQIQQQLGLNSSRAAQDEGKTKSAQQEQMKQAESIKNEGNAEIRTQEKHNVHVDDTKNNKESITASNTTSSPVCDYVITSICDEMGLEPSLTVVKAFPKTVRLAIGVHPKSIGFWGSEQEYSTHPGFLGYMERLERDVLNNPEFEGKIVAWGEIGLDYSHRVMTSSLGDNIRRAERSAFIHFIKLGVEKYKLPLQVHSRCAEEDTVEIMLEHIPRDWPIHVHGCFNGDGFLRKLLSHFTRVYIGITCAVENHSNILYYSRPKDRYVYSEEADELADKDRYVYSEEADELADLPLCEAAEEENAKPSFSFSSENMEIRTTKNFGTTSTTAPSGTKTTTTELQNDADERVQDGIDVEANHSSSTSTHLDSTHTEIPSSPAATTSAPDSFSLETKLMRQIRTIIPLNRLLVETDAPYLPPMSGRRPYSFPALLPRVIRVIASIKALPTETVANQIRQNTRDVYGI